MVIPWNGCNANNSRPVSVAKLQKMFFKKDFHYILLGIVQPILGFFGVTLNACFLVMLFRDKDMRTITNFYLANLAVADSIFLAYNSILELISLYATPYSSDRAFTGQYGCIYHSIIYYTTFYVALFLVTLVSMDRFLAICHPLSHRKIAGKNRAVKLVISAWLLALSISIGYYIPITGRNNLMCFKPVPPDPDVPGSFSRCLTYPAIRSREFYKLGDPIMQIVPFFVCFIGEYFC